MNTWNI